MIRSGAILVVAVLCASACSQQKVDTAAATTATGETNSPAPAEVLAMEEPDESAPSPDELAAADEFAAAEGPVALGAVSDEERMLALAALGLDHDPDGQTINDCGEAVEPDVHAIDMGGAVGRALLIVMKGGPTTAACYGDTGMKFFLMKQDGENYKTVASDMGHFAVMETETAGVKNFAVGGPGFEFPVYEWNGRTFVSLRTIPDTELPETVN